jgi:hypothetical protein
MDYYTNYYMIGQAAVAFGAVLIGAGEPALVNAGAPGRI